MAGESTVAKIRKMRTIEEDEDDNSPMTTSTGRPTWMIALRTYAEEWLRILPEALSSPVLDLSPLGRFFAREISTGSGLLLRIRRDLLELMDACSGAVKQTNEVRALMDDLSKSTSESFRRDYDLTDM